MHPRTKHSFSPTSQTLWKLPNAIYVPNLQKELTQKKKEQNRGGKRKCKRKTMEGRESGNGGEKEEKERKKNKAKRLVYVV